MPPPLDVEGPRPHRSGSEGATQRGLGDERRRAGVPDAGGLCIGHAVLPWTRARAWWVRAWDSRASRSWSWARGRRRPLAAGRTAGRGEGAVLALAAALAWQVAIVLPYTRLGAAGCRPGRQRRARRAAGHGERAADQSSGRRAGRSLAAADPDLVLALETDRWWVERLAELLPEPRPPGPASAGQHLRLGLFSRLELVAPRSASCSRMASPRCGQASACARARTSC